jgi:hypothetical protein
LHTFDSVGDEGSQCGGKCTDEVALMGEHDRASDPAVPGADGDRRIRISTTQPAATGLTVTGLAQRWPRLPTRHTCARKDEISDFGPPAHRVTVLASRLEINAE